MAPMPRCTTSCLQRLAPVQAGPLVVTTTSHNPAMGDKVSVSGTVTIYSEDPGKARQTLKQDMVFRLGLGLGKLAERAARSSFLDEAAKMPAIMEQWATARAELAATPEGRLRLLAGQPDLRHLPWVQAYYAAMVPDQAQPGHGRAGGRRRACRGGATATRLAAGTSGREPSGRRRAGGGRGCARAGAARWHHAVLGRDLLPGALRLQPPQGGGGVAWQG